MNTRILISGTVTAGCLIAALAVVAQHRQLASLKEDQRQLQTRTATPPESEMIQASASSPAHPSAEVLELRSKVTQLMARKAQLAGARVENEQLQSQLTVAGNTASPSLPPDYIRARDAQWVGASTIENTIQSFLWALRHHDTNALFQVLTAESAEGLRQQLQHSSPDDFFKDASVMPGMRIAERRQLSDGTVEAKMEMLPGKPELASFRFQLVQGQWKMDLR